MQSSPFLQPTEIQKPSQHVQNLKDTIEHFFTMLYGFYGIQSKSFNKGIGVICNYLFQANSELTAVARLSACLHGHVHPFL